MRITRVVRVGGRFSSMLDMGGMSADQASASSRSKIDLGKNNKIRAVALDFNLISKSIEEHRRDNRIDDVDGMDGMDGINDGVAKKHAAEPSTGPPTNAVQDMAKLLGVNLNLNLDGQQIHTRKHRHDDGIHNDDLSLLLGKDDESDKTNSKTNNSNNNSNNNRTSKQAAPQSNTNTNTGTSQKPNNPIAHLDIRAKYAAKLRTKVDGGIPGIDLANTQKEEALQRGDAAGHLLARSIAAAQPASTSGSKWIATTGIGALLSFLSMRSIKIALMPLPRTMTQDEIMQMRDDMERLTRQLSTVQFDLLLDGQMNHSSEAGRHTHAHDHDPTDVAKSHLVKFKDGVELDPMSTLVVTNQDAYLRSARDMGCYTCRVRKSNEPRGNITTNYSAEDMSEVQDVVNQLNGISFNTVFTTPR